MIAKNKVKLFLFATCLICMTSSCHNHIDKFDVKTDDLKKLPDNFYAYHRGSILLESLSDTGYRIWFNFDNNDNIGNVFKIDDLKNNKEIDLDSVIKTRSIDTSNAKVNAQLFIDLSRKYKFGHILIDKANKISFSYIKDLPEECVMPLNDSIKNIYLKKEDFKQLPNGWFEHVEQ
ncbi:hypothetical protein [Ferruginibacter albus]|uniref:hypothetical protein n=1 Tax=Ferruginibacter albus TaxID=2875540 RepID=UPI001CC79EC9|nr:hypothetical protein [Ferruginibacter albus]UAY53575.1 hypothetical protein K9M53_07885 [Ferruginibacter albus]